MNRGSEWALGLCVLGVTALLSSNAAAASGSSAKNFSCDAVGKPLTESQRPDWDVFERARRSRTHLACVDENTAKELEPLRSRGGANAELELRIAELKGQSNRLLAFEAKKDDEAKATFMGMAFGVGMGFSQAKDRVESAAIAADGTVRVLTREKQSPRVILEAHYYGACRKLQTCNDGTFGFGPFFGIATSSDSAIDAFALGIMFGVKDASAGSNGGFSLGIGAVLDRKVKTLARGFEEGAKVPAGVVDVVYQTKSKWSPLLMFTRTF